MFINFNNCIMKSIKLSNDQKEVVYGAGMFIVVVAILLIGISLLDWSNVTALGAKH